MLRLYRYLLPYWWQSLLLVGTVGIQVWNVLMLPALMANIVNDGIAKGDQAFIWQTGIIMIVVALVAGICAVLSSYLSAVIGSRISRDLRNDIFTKVMSFSISDVDKFSTASLITRTTNDVDQVNGAIIMTLSMLLRAPLMCVGAIIQAVRTAPDMTWIIALAVIIIVSLVAIILSLVMPKFTLYQQLIDRVTLESRENITGLRVVRAFNNQAHEASKFNRTNNRLLKTDVFIGRLMSLQSPLMMLVFNGTSLLCIWIGVQHLPENAAYLGNMIAFMQYATQVIMSFLFLTVLFVMLPRANVSAKRINAILDTKPKITWAKKTLGVPDKTPSVEFKDVSFAYDGAEENVLTHISFKATAGTTTAFIGSTGSGKSTLINLIPRFHEVTSGEILINGLNIKNYAEDDLMDKIGFVPQRGFLFTGTIRSNLRFGAPDASDQDLKIATDIAQATSFIDKLGSGLSTHIAEGGTNVSGGQRQRLSIARALAKKPSILVFDDSFSALDLKTDAKLRQALKPIQQSTVTLIVAQRIGTVRDAEQIVVLDKGNLVGRGTHYQLLSSCKVYREIARSQLSDQEFSRELKRSHHVRPH